MPFQACSVLAVAARSSSRGLDAAHDTTLELRQRWADTLLELGRAEQPKVRNTSMDPSRKVFKSRCEFDVNLYKSIHITIEPHTTYAPIPIFQSKTLPCPVPFQQTGR